jgi:glycosyltransferase involved in cell wall biosynthesis
MSKFSIIAVDYENHVPRQGMMKGLNSLANQTFKDFELIVVHDGPKEIAYEEEFDFSVFKNKPIFLNTPERMNNWGHSGRDLGMRNASGDFFFHFNIDNLLYPDCLEKINNKLETTNALVVLFAILHYKINNGTIPFYGLPPVYHNIDALQLVAHREIWKGLDYWYDLHEQGDSAIYQRICENYGWAYIDEVLAENY